MSISIVPGPWRRISCAECHGGDILIERLGSGVGVFVFDAVSKATFAGHFAAPDVQVSEDSDGLFAMLAQSIDEFRDSPLVHMYVSGCAEQDDAPWGNKGSVTHRFVEAELRKRQQPNQQLDVRWPRSNVLFAEMSLYPDSGQYECGFRW